MALPGSDPRAPWSGSTWMGAVVITVWLVACDAWIKLAARVAACTGTPTVAEASSEIWDVPAGCAPTDFWGVGHLSAFVRDGGPFGLGAGLLDGRAGQGWALGLLAITAVLSGLLLRWRWRSPGDAFALGAVWGAVIILTGPRLASGGAGTAELQLGGMTTGIGDLALVWVVGWLVWRWIAEARA